MTPAASAQTFELLTPCFCAGFSKTQPEMRIASIRGQLRWWARVLYGNGRPEYELFGGIRGRSHDYPDEGVASSFKFRLSVFANNAVPEDQCLVPHNSKKRGYWVAALPAQNRYMIEWVRQAHPDFCDKSTDLINGQTRQHRLEQVLKAWLLLGTIGRRATRAAGSVWPVDYAPTVEAFDAAVEPLCIPSTVKVAVLNSTTSNPRDTAKGLRDIADMTVHGLERCRKDARSGEILGGIEGDPLGYVAGNRRKSSPLRFKVGRFADGYRLIAVWDNRNERGGNLQDAKHEMKASYPSAQLVQWLATAGF